MRCSGAVFSITFLISGEMQLTSAVDSAVELSLVVPRFFRAFNHRGRWPRSGSRSRTGR